MTSIKTKEQPVLLTIRSEQRYTDMDPDSIELVTEGTLSVTREGEIRLSYEESELTGMEGTTTVFTVQGPRVILSRTGRVNSQMVFEEGKQHTSLYETPFGELAIDIQTSRLRHSLTERGGLLDLQYSISVDHSAAGRNAFKIRVRPAPAKS
ncbi:DUF1934 domain-containing protein [Oscillospiraceae bacterium 38-13]